MKTALILGVSGQDGAYLSHFLLSKAYAVHGTSRDPEATNFSGLERLDVRGDIIVHRTDLTNSESMMELLRLVKPCEIYHLAGQSSVGLSFSYPAETIASISTSTLTLLEALRELKSDARVFNTGSSECYGNCATPVREGSPFHPHSPYAEARQLAYQAAKHYRESHGMFVATGILANHESPLRPDRFVTRKIVQVVRRIKNGSNERLSLGNVRVQRDWGWAPEFVEAFWLLLQANKPDDYNIATGETNALSDFVMEAFAAAGLDWADHVDIDNSLKRPSEFQATRMDVSKISTELGWRARYKMRHIVQFLIARDEDRGLGPIPWQDVT